MRSELANQLVRSVVLLLLLTYFGYSLVHGLIEDERQKSPLMPGSLAHQDPGVRVLLENRPASDAGGRAGTEPQPAWERLDITILQGVEVLDPSSPDDPARHLQLHSGSVLHLQPDTTTGLLLSSKEWGKDYTWPISQLWILPLATDPEAPLLPSGQRAALGQRDPCLFEAGDHGEVFALAGASYRGSLEVLYHSPKDVEAVNVLPMEAYVDGVIAVEMAPYFPLQALKAQAVVSRSYAYYFHRRAVENRLDYDINDIDQQYRGAGKGNESVSTATSETRGMILLVDGDQFEPLFCASSGGYTESIDNIYPGMKTYAGLEPLNTVMMSAPDPHCQAGAEALHWGASHWQSTTTIVPDDLRKKLAKLLAPENRPVGFIRSLRAGKRNPHSGRVLSVLIFHTASNDPIELSANSFRLLVGANTLRSTLWSADSPRRIDYTDSRNPTYEITCTGFGHGVGLSQVSAYEMANEDYSYQAILSFFYLRTTVKSIW